MGVVNTSGSLTDVKRPEHALKLFIRFAIAKGVVTYGLDLMMAIFDIAQDAMRTIKNASDIGVSFLKSYAGVCLEGAIIVLACIIFSKFAASPSAMDNDVAAATMVWKYVVELVFNMLVLVGMVKMSDSLVNACALTRKNIEIMKFM